jgi:hypothetical protein
MWNVSALLSHPTDLLTGNRYMLSDEIYGMQLLPTDGQTFKVGPVIRLPKGAQLNACGKGFNDRTVKVCCDGSFYLVFLTDLDT